MTPQRALGGGRRSRPFTDLSARFAQQRRGSSSLRDRAGSPRVPSAPPPHPLPSLLQAGLPPSFLPRPSPRPASAGAAAPRRVGEGPRVRTRGLQRHSSTFWRAAPVRGWRGRARALSWRQRARVAGRGWGGRCEGSVRLRGALRAQGAWTPVRGLGGHQRLRGSGSCEKTVGARGSVRAWGRHKGLEGCEGSVRA